MRLQRIDHRKFYSSPFSVQGKRKREKKLLPSYRIRREATSQGKLENSWNEAERSHVYAVMQNPIESDPVASLSTLFLFFSLHCGHPDRRIKRPWKDDYIFDQSAEAGAG